MVVSPALEGHGVAGELVRAALDDARRQGLAMVPLCPYVVIFIGRHPERIELVPVEERAPRWQWRNGMAPATAPRVGVPFLALSAVRGLAGIARRCYNHAMAS